MEQPEGPGRIEFGGPATYRIVVRGALSTDWSDRLAGMVITDTTGNVAAPTTVLEGLIRDPSELSGVLDTLSDLHLSILRLEQVEGQA